MEAVTRMKRVQRFKPTAVSLHHAIQWNGTVGTAIPERRGGKGDLQHGDPMLYEEPEIGRCDGIWIKGIISCYVPSFCLVFMVSISTTGRWVDIEQIVMPAHELQLTCGRRVDPIQHFPISQRFHGHQPRNRITERRDHNERFQRNRKHRNQFQL